MKTNLNLKQNWYYGFHDAYMRPYAKLKCTSSRCACLLACEGTILPLLVYRDPDGIKKELCWCKQKKMASGGQQCRVFILIPWKQRNGIIRRICYRVMQIFIRKYTHKYMEHGVNFDVFDAQGLQRMMRDQNRVDFLTIMQLAATFQH